MKALEQRRRVSSLKFTQSHQEKKDLRHQHAEATSSSPALPVHGKQQQNK